MKFFWQNLKRAKLNDFTWVVVNQVILSLGAFALIVVLSNVLGAETFGKARFLTAALAIFTFFSLPGMGPVVLQQMPLYSYDGFKQALLVQSKWGVGATIGALLLAVLLYLQGDIDLARAFVISGILAPVVNLYLMPGTALAGQHDFARKTLYDGAIISCTVLGTWYGALTTGTVTGTMLWYYGTQAMATVVAVYFVKQHLTSTVNPTFDFKADIRMGKQLTLFQLPFTLLPALEKMLVFIFLGPVSLALYTIAFLPVEHITNVYRNTLQFFVLPKLQMRGAWQQNFYHWLLMAFLLSLVSIVAIGCFTFLLLSEMFPKYAQVKTIMLLSAIIPLALPAHLYILKILYERQTERLYTYAIVTVVIEITIFVMLTATYGLIGTVVAKIMASLFAAVTAYVLYRSR